MLAYILNLTDLLFTLIAINYLNLRELNPFMQNVYFMIFYKIVVIGVLLLWLSSRPERAAKVGLRICTIAYGALFIYHILGITSILEVYL